MFSIRAFVRPAAVALALAFGLAAAPAAAGSQDKPAAADAKKGRGFPMTAESFNKHIEKRISKTSERVNAALAKQSLTEAQKTQIKKDLDDGNTAVRALANKVKADGTVTKEEAKQVRDLAKDVRKKAFAKAGIKGKGKGKDKGKDRGGKKLRQAV